MQLLMRRPEIDGFIAVAPPANMFDFGFLAPCPSSGLIIQGDQDQLVPPKRCSGWSTKLVHQRDIRSPTAVIPGADHFFQNHQEPLAAVVEEYIAGNPGKRAAAAGR